MWSDVAQLRLLGAWLQWLAIALVFIGGFLQVAKFVVDRREKTLTTIEQAERQKPANQIITSGSATVEVIADSADATNSHFLDRGGFLGFGKGTNAMMMFTSIDCFGKQNGRNEVVWRGVFSLDAGDSSIGKRIGFLRDAEYIQVGFAPMPPESTLKGGRAVITINGSIRFAVDIPPQRVTSGQILVRDLTQFMAALE